MKTLSTKMHYDDNTYRTYSVEFDNIDNDTLRQSIKYYNANLSEDDKEILVSDDFDGVNGKLVNISEATVIEVTEQILS